MAAPFSVGVLLGTALVLSRIENFTPHSLVVNATKSAPAAPARWRESELVVGIDTSLRALGPDVRGALERALIAWYASRTPLPRLRFEWIEGVEPSLEVDGRNTISLGEIPFAGHEDDLAVTVSFSRLESGLLSEADILINSKYLFGDLAPAESLATGLSAALAGDGVLAPMAAWTPSSSRRKNENRNATILFEVQSSSSPSLTNTQGFGPPNSPALECAGTYDLENVLTHEFGHFFGLGENRENRAATMFSSTSSCETHKRTLSADDTHALRTLYGSKSQVGCALSASPSRRSQNAILFFLLTIGTLVRRALGKH